MSFARCISAISAGDLIMRQPAVTGSALDELTRRRFSLDAVEDEEPHTLFDADAAGGAPRSLRMPATSLYGLSSSCQTRTSFANLISSRARCLLERRADPRELAFRGDHARRTGAR